MQAIKTIPYPGSDQWRNHRPLPEMEGKVFGSFAHAFIKPGEQDRTQEIYKKIVDVAIEEKTCTVLSAQQSLVDQTHFVLYEEWTDYNDFIEVQVSRTYRKAFVKWITPVLKAFSGGSTEMFYSSGTHPYNLAYNAFTMAQSVHVKKGQESKAREILQQHIDEVAKDSQNILANAHQCLPYMDNPQHFILYEIWSGIDHLTQTELQSDRRNALVKDLEKLIDPEQPEPALELFKIYYDPDKYSPNASALLES